MRAKSVYATSKIACENLLWVYREYKGIIPTAVRLGATIGKKMTHGLIPDLVRKLKDNNETLELIGSKPGTSKVFTHVDDVIDGLLLLKNKEVDIVNLCLHDNISVEKITELAQSCLNISKPISWTGSTWKGDNLILRANNSLAINLGWRPKYNTSEKAIERCFNEYLE